MTTTQSIDEIINKSGKSGSIERLKCIASLSLGQRSISAQRCIDKRARRKELMQDYNMPKDIVRIVIEREFDLKN
jgi:hypothetical protein